MAIDGLMAAGGALATGVDPDAILAGLASFDGVGRRFELKGEVGGVTVLDDYAHHPTAMRATFAAARQRYPGRRLWAVYEPLTYHRTAAMLDDFAEVLAEADRAAVIDIWAVRDPDRTITSAAALADAVTARSAVPAAAIGSPEAAAAGWPTRSSRATSSWSWAAAGRTWPPSSWSSAWAPAASRARGYHCGTAARGARLAHVRRLRHRRHDARDLRSRVGDLRWRPDRLDVHRRRRVPRRPLRAADGRPQRDPGLLARWLR